MNYAIKTTKGYLATQGNEHWFQDEPKGWALFTSAEHARDVGEAHHSAIGTRPEEGYTVEAIPERKTTHTPGPWSVHNNVGKKGELGIVADSAPCVIAHGMSEKHWPEIAQANAQLIACSPDMVESLEEAERVIRFAAQEARGRVKSEIVEGWVHHADKIASTIAKTKWEA